MKGQRFVILVAGTVAFVFGSMQSGIGQATADGGGVPVSMVVTQKNHRGSEVAFIAEKDVSVYQGRSQAKITEWVPLRGEQAGLALFILLDDSGRTSRGSQLEEIGRFILAQPASTKIGIAYMDTGGPRIVQGLTADHDLAAQALHASTGNLAVSSSPYIALSDLVKHWPEGGGGRREILMVSSGVDALDGGNRMGQDNIYVDAAIAEAQKAGIVVSTFSTAARNSGEADSGARNYLAQVAQATGGESYYYAFGTPVSFAPYLQDSSQLLTQQYRLTFLAKPAKAGELQPVRVRTDVKHVELVSPEKVYVPGIRNN